MKPVRTAFEFLIQSNIFIALAAVCYTIQAQIQLGLQPQLHPYLFLIFFATLFEYNSHRFITIISKRELLHIPRHQWVKDNLRLFYGIVFISLGGFIISAALAKREVLEALLPLGILTLFYSFPLYKTGRRLFRLRGLPLAKIFIISFIWSASTLLLPYIHAGYHIDLLTLLPMVLERFLFIFALTIPFDIRDMENDKRTGVKTVPLLLGAENSMRLCDVLLLAFVVISFYNNPLHLFVGLFISAVVTFICLHNKAIAKQRYYHYGVLDGCIIMQGLLVVTMQYFAKG